jgi:hypothetical protein
VKSAPTQRQPFRDPADALTDVEILEVVDSAKHCVERAVGDGTGSTGAPGSGRPQCSQAAQLVQLSEELELWHTPEGKAFATGRIGEHVEHWAVNSGAIRAYLTRRYYELHGKPPGAHAVHDAQQWLAARAVYDGAVHDSALRVAEDASGIYIDLCDAEHRVVLITSAGWSIVNDPPIRFRRAKGMMALPTPTEGGSLDALRPFVNVTDKDFLLLAAILVAAYRPTGPYPILIIQGEQGSAKSTTARIVRALVDPNQAPLRSLPRDERDLMIAARNGHLQSFDNLSYLSDFQSDWLSRLSTGGGWATRELYADDEEVIFQASRPIVLNGIEDLARRDDLRDRTVILEQPPIPAHRRRDERAFWADFEEKRPAILGALFDVVSTALRNFGTVQLQNAPRMADFAKWALAAEPALTSERGAFLRAYDENRTAAIDFSLEHSPVAAAIRSLLENTGEWRGKTQELLTAISNRVGEDVRREKDWPKTARALTNALKRLAPSLRGAGIEWTPPDRKNSRRDLQLTRTLDATGRTGCTGAPETGDAVTPCTSGAVPVFSDASAGPPSTPSRQLGEGDLVEVELGNVNADTASAQRTRPNENGGDRRRDPGRDALPW